MCVCVELAQDIHQFARAPKNTHHYILITLYILIQTPLIPRSLISLLCNHDALILKIEFRVRGLYPLYAPGGLLLFNATEPALERRVLGLEEL